MKTSNWFVGQNGNQIDIYAHVIPDNEAPRTITIAANVPPEVARVLVEMRNDFEGRLERIEAGLTRIAIEAEKVQKLWEQEKEA